MGPAELDLCAIPVQILKPGIISEHCDGWMHDIISAWVLVFLEQIE